MKILLVDPPSLACHTKFNLGLAYLNSCLRAKGQQVWYIDFNQGGREKAMKQILQINPDILCVSVNFFSVPGQRDILRRLKVIEKLKSFFVAGGPQVTLQGRDFLTDNPLYDCLCLGEAEITLEEIARVLAQGNPEENLKNIPGAIFNLGDEIVETPKRQLLANLDTLPFPLYPDTLFLKQSFYPLITSRGCAYECVFCPSKFIFGGGWRPRSVENVISEIALAIHKYGVKRFCIFDDNFNYDLKRAKQILREVIKNKFKLEFSLANGVRLDNLDDEFLLLLKESGCIRIAVGIESADAQTYKQVNKAISLEQIAQGVNRIKQYGFKPEAFMVIGLMGSSCASEQRSLDFIKQLRILARWYIAIPFAHTPFYNWVKQRGRLLDNPKIGTGNWSGKPTILFETEEFTQKEMLRVYYYNNSETGNFYFLCSGRNYFLLFLTGCYRSFKYNPKKLPHFIGWALKAALNYRKIVLNENWRK